MEDRTVTTEMRIIHVLDPNASLHLSEYTGKWYVSSQIHISNGALISGISEHRDSPEDAVSAHLARLVNVGPAEVVVTGENRNRGGRRHWRWNGHAWTDASDRIAVS